jgi:nitric oxide synthase oxygenase domain/subunit
MIAKYGIVISNKNESSGILSIELKGDVIRDATAEKSQKNYLYVARVVFRLDNRCQTRLYEGSFKTVDQAKTIQSSKLNALNKLAKGVENSSFSTALSQY